jgi:hypothetical protein
LRELSTIGRLSLPPGQGNVMFPVNSLFRLALIGLRRSGLAVPHPGPAAQGVHALGGRCGTSLFRTLRASSGFGTGLHESPGANAAGTQMPRTLTGPCPPGLFRFTETPGCDRRTLDLVEHRG